MLGDTVKYAGVMLLAGIGIPVLATLNARLGARIGSPAVAAMVVFTVAFCAGLVVMLLTTGPGPMRQLPTQPAYLFTAGLFMAFYVVSVTIIGRKFGIGNAIFCVLLGQMVSATLIDHFGLGAALHPLDLSRSVGLTLMTGGLFLILKG